ncbi:MAG: hypothetical protein M3O46_10560, partial [Myxococcota bacterium]|nr:hypothetical protein [Myxococcota bacterium]
MTRPAAVGILVLTLGASVATPGNAQPRSSPASSPTSAGRAAAASGLRAHFGTDIATRLLRSGDADERVRGMARLAAIHTPEALALLERTAGAAVPG